MFCFEIPILLAYILKLTGCGVYNLDIASHIFLAPNFTEVVEAGKCQIRSQKNKKYNNKKTSGDGGSIRRDLLREDSLFICNFGHIKFMVT
jgi:hypothetical protein